MGLENKKREKTFQPDMSEKKKQQKSNVINGKCLEQVRCIVYVSLWLGLEFLFIDKNFETNTIQPKFYIKNILSQKIS